jgi:hypothetical protein
MQRRSVSLTWLGEKPLLERNSIALRNWSIAFIRSWTAHNRPPLPEKSITDLPNTGQSGRLARCIAGLYSGYEYPYDLPVTQSTLADIVTVESDSVDAALPPEGRNRLSTLPLQLGAYN